MQTWMAWEHLWALPRNKPLSFRTKAWMSRRTGEQDRSRLARQTKCEGEALSLVSLVPRPHGLEAWRVLKDELRGEQRKSYGSALERHPQPTGQLGKCTVWDVTSANYLNPVRKTWPSTEWLQAQISTKQFKQRP